MESEDEPGFGLLAIAESAWYAAMGGGGEVGGGEVRRGEVRRQMHLATRACVIASYNWIGA